MNLSWALKEMLAEAQRQLELPREELLEALYAKAAAIHADVMGSDHCPVELQLDI